MPSKIFILTGSTSGIGEETAIGLAAHCDMLILPVRNMEKGEALKTRLLTISPALQIGLILCDLTSIASIKSCAKIVVEKYDHIDVLINNAGIINTTRELTADGLEETFAVNVLSQFLFNTLLLPLVQKAPQGRIINLSSLGHRMGKLDFSNIQGEKNWSGFGAYFNSNFERNLLTSYQANQLKDTNITVNCLHPGAIQSNLGVQNKGVVANFFIKFFSRFAKPTAEGAKTTLYAALSPELTQITGAYLNNQKIGRATPASQDLATAKKFWEYCENLAK